MKTRAVVALASLLAGVIAFAVPAASAGVVINVPASQPTIQAAIDVASAGDTVVVAPGTYFEHIDFKGKAIEVRSSAGPETTIIDGGGTPNVVTFKTGEARTSVLWGFTVSGGADRLPASGLGILIHQASPTVVGNIVTGNTAPAGLGVGISSEGGSPLIEGNEIVDNPGGTAGGGIYANGGRPEILGNFIAGHSAHSGAGVSLNTGTLRDNVIVGNDATMNGGGVNANGNVELVNNLIVFNSAATGGGVAWGWGETSSAFFLNNTVADNDAPAGSALHLGGSGATLINNVLTGPAGSSVVSCSNSAPGGTVFSHNDVYNGTSSRYAGCSDATGTNSNVSADPLFDDVYTLLAGSPAIDSGHFAPQVPTTDLDGNPRVADGDGDGVAVVDMGAVETQPFFGADYHSLTPARILDTRAGNGAPVGRLGAASTLSLQVTGRGGVPADGVTAVVLNVTVTEPTAGSFLTAWPAGSTRPLVSNLNYVPGQTVANLVTVKVGDGGKVNLFNFSGTTHVIADVAGWYGADDGGRYSPLSPARILDTRAGNGAPTAKLAAGATLSLQVTGRGGVPAGGVSAVVLNVTVTDTASGGFLTAWPAGEPMPLASNLNFLPGDTVPNLAILKVGAGGAVNLYSSGGPVSVIADVAGYFGDAGGAGAGFAPVEPARVLDTRTGNGAPAAKLPAGGQLSLQVTGRGGVPAAGVSAVVLNVTVTEPASGGFLTAWPAGEARPLVSNLNYVPGQTVPNLVVVKVGTDGKVNLYGSGGPVHVIADVAGWFTD